jgi:hypothetical protein
MRGKISDQDLTDYALNELQPDERLYVESMLGVSEECRHDVYQMLDLSEMLKEGYEIENSAEALLLNQVQRSKVLDVPRWQWSSFLQRAAAIVLLGAGTAFLLTRPALMQKGATDHSMANAGGAVKNALIEVKQKGFAKTAEEFTALIQKSSPIVQQPTWQFISAPAVCTPPVFTDESESVVAEM